MLELIIERWSDLTAGTAYRWSLWQDGKRVLMGGPHKTAEASEQDGRVHCKAELGRTPDRVTRL